jgi:hypothetical protein
MLWLTVVSTLFSAVAVAVVVTAILIGQRAQHQTWAARVDAQPDAPARHRQANRATPQWR